jgi:hypothetical protein
MKKKALQTGISRRMCLLNHDLKAIRDSSMSHSRAFAQEFLDSSNPIEIWARRSYDLQHSRLPDR